MRAATQGLFFFAAHAHGGQVRFGVDEVDGGGHPVRPLTRVAVPSTGARR